MLQQTESRVVQKSKKGRHGGEDGESEGKMKGLRVGGSQVGNREMMKKEPHGGAGRIWKDKTQQNNGERETA